MSLLLQAVWLLWLLGALVVEAQSDQVDISQLYFDVLASYNAFPPLDTAEVWTSGTTEPIQVALASTIISIDVISPATSEFTVSSRKLLYWNKEACNQTEAHQYACSNLLGGIHFLTPVNSDGNSKANKLQINREKVHESEFEALDLPELTPSLDLVEDQVTYKQQFDVKTYPFEYHNLEIHLASLYSSNIVNISMLPLDAGILNPSVPAGWTLQEVDCYVRKVQEGRAITEVSEGEIYFPTYTCIVQVSRENKGWWITSFLLFIGLNVIAYVGGLGVASHFVAEARDDKDGARQGLFNGLRLNGVFSIGLLLTYVFQVEIAPYGQPVEFWPSTAASTIIYMLGLVGILVFSALSMTSALFFKRILVADGFNGSIMHTYDLPKVPKEGEAPEEEFPLINRQKESNDESKQENQKADKPAHTRDRTEGTIPTVVSNGETLADNTSIEVTEQSPELPIPYAVKYVPAVDKDSSADAPEPTPASRRNNTKKYSVLSVQEAILINRLVRLEFFVMTTLITVIAVCGAIILMLANNDYQDAIS